LILCRIDVKEKFLASFLRDKGRTQSPLRIILKEKDETAVMKTLRQFLTASAFIILASAAAFGQKNDDPQKKPPKPKDNPPIVIVVPKDEKKPRENNRPKKPQGEMMEVMRTLRAFD
jgi:hypothetical protein